MRYLFGLFVLIVVAAVGASIWLSSAAGQPKAIIEAMNRDVLAADLPPIDQAKAKDALTRVNFDSERTESWRPSYVADWEALGYPAWCGTGGCRHQLFVADRRTQDYHLAFPAVPARSKVFITRPGGAVSLAFERTPFPYEIDIKPFEPRLLLVELTDSCGGEGQPKCVRKRLEWNPEHTLLRAP